MSTSDFDDFPLSQSEELDSDQVRNDDGDDVADPPEQWIPARDDENLDERLAEEEPDVTDDGEDVPTEAHDSDQGGGLQLESDAELDEIDPEEHGRTRGQIDGTPEDGESFFDIVE
ncbi:hypothetical protein [Mycolicibacterium sp. 050158]|jgi:hypothetical protein|uniref:hypothetical protein n=1 Tax=Mycolicibacterium sp. 050158 TaxID=3090602 RepID=UPI00299EFB30|nr:hypothetical protein [Mycolicibacterium sp. 050158]MDX1889466.1 hypothetical protein [Mycolicibacterium sp. 050158]